MKLIFNTIILLLICYLGFIQNIVFFKVAWFLLCGIVVLIMIFMFIAFVFIQDKVVISLKEGENKPKDFISKNRYTSLIWGLTSIGMQGYMVYLSYPVFASFYFIFFTLISIGYFNLRKLLI